MDTKFLMYIPGWVKLVAVIILLAMSSLSILVIFISWEETPDKHVLIKPAMTMAQISLSALALLLMFIFARKGASAERFNTECEEYLNDFLPARLQQIDFEFPEYVIFKPKKLYKKIFSSFKLSARSVNVPKSKAIVNVQKPINVPFALYRISAYETEMRIFVQVNVKEIVILYYIPVENTDIENIKKIVLPTFDDSSSKKLRDYYVASSIRNIAILNGKECLVVQLSWAMESDFLLNGNEKLFVANMIALITRSLFMRCEEFGINLYCDKT